MTEPDSPLYSNTPTLPQESSSPLIVLGLPRSGSSYLSYLISQLNDWFIFDDLYLLRKAKSINAIDEPLNSAQLQELVKFLGWQLRARIRYQKFFHFIIQFEDVDRIDQAMLSTFKDCTIFWHDLQAEWLYRIARHHGCHYWGYKAPQDFMHIDILNHAYPDARFLYLFRDPRAIMASLKFLDSKSSHDGDSRLYHPSAYARYWKMAYQSMQKSLTNRKNHSLLVKYEDFVDQPLRQTNKIADFLGANSLQNIDSGVPNSSFRSGERLTISPTETWICETINGDAMKSLGYNAMRGKLRLRDTPALLYQSVLFAMFQFHRFLTDKPSRESVIQFVKNLWSR